MALAAILSFRVKSYAVAIYVDGYNRLTARDGFPGVAAGYCAAVQEYAATGYINEMLDKASFTGYTDNQINLALASGWISQQEYDETMAYRMA